MKLNYLIGIFRDQKLTFNKIFIADIALSFLEQDMFKANVNVVMKYS